MRKKLLSALTMGVFVAAGLMSQTVAQAATTNTKSTAAKSTGAKKSKPAAAKNAAAAPAKGKKAAAVDQWQATRQLAVASTAETEMGDVWLPCMMSLPCARSVPPV